MPIFLTACSKPDIITQIDGKTYYYYEEGYMCRPVYPGSKKIESWKDKIEFKKGRYFVWKDKCNDAPFSYEIDLSKFKFSPDLSQFEYNSKIYKVAK